MPYRPAHWHSCQPPPTLKPPMKTTCRYLCHLTHLCWRPCWSPPTSTKRDLFQCPCRYTTTKTKGRWKVIVNPHRSRRASQLTQASVQAAGYDPQGTLQNGHNSSQFSLVNASTHRLWGDDDWPSSFPLWTWTSVGSTPATNTWAYVPMSNIGLPCRWPYPPSFVYSRNNIYCH